MTRVFNNLSLCNAEFSYIIRAHFLISGHVQGVGYRYATVDTTQMGLSAWVRNLPDKPVEAVFEGWHTMVTEMIRWCHQGPPAAVLEDLVVEYETSEGLAGFELKGMGSIEN